MIVLTYDALHHKTQQILFQLKAAGYTDVDIVATPWIARKPRQCTLPQRAGDPGWWQEPLQIAPMALAQRLGYNYTVLASNNLAEYFAASSAKFAIIGGAGILPAGTVNAMPILNLHPGLLPYCRGLDSLKWALLEGRPLGITAHIIDDSVDSGWLIAERQVPIRLSDSYHSYAGRFYETELDTLLPALEIIGGTASLRGLPRIPQDGSPPTRRLPQSLEAEVLRCFAIRRDMEAIDA